MTDDYITANLKYAVKKLFTITNRKQLKVNVARKYLTEELKWMVPEDFMKFISECSSRDIIHTSIGNITMNFDPDDVIVPENFSFSMNILKKGTPTPLKTILKRISEHTDYSDDEILNEIKNIKNRLDIVTEVAALIFAHENNIKTDDLTEDIKKQIKIYYKQRQGKNNPDFGA